MTINISINLASMGIGILIGVTITFIVIFKVFYDARWEIGFGAGWDARSEQKLNERETK